MTHAKTALVVAWLLCAAGFVVAPDSTLATFARYAFWLMLAAHVIEYLLFFQRVQRAPGTFLSHFFNTIVFGLVHIRELSTVDEADNA